MTIAINQLFAGFMIEELRAVRNSPHQRHIAERKARRHRETPQAHANSIADVLSEAAGDTESAPESAANLAACLKDARSDGFKPRITRENAGITVRAGRATTSITITPRQREIVQRVIALANQREVIA